MPVMLPAMRYNCPLPKCGWGRDIPARPAPVDEEPSAVELVMREHADSHTPIEYLAVLADARDEIHTVRTEREQYRAASRHFAFRIRHTAHVWATTLPETIRTEDVVTALSGIASHFPDRPHLRDDLWMRIAGAYEARFEYDGHPEDARHAADEAMEVVQPVVDELRAERDQARAWWGHWKRRAITMAVRLGRALEPHRPAMDGGGIATGRCTCGEPHPCATRRAAGPLRPSWEDDCDCAPNCPAAHCANPDAPAEYGDGAWGSVWLHGNWRYLTEQMTTEEREHAADAVARWDQGLADVDGEQGRPEPEGLRWWRGTPAAASSPYTGGPTPPRPTAGATAPEPGPGDGE